MQLNKIGFCTVFNVEPPDPEVIIYDRDCEFCGEQMKQYQERLGHDIRYYYICETPNCDDYDIEIEADTYTINKILHVE